MQRREFLIAGALAASSALAAEEEFTPPNLRISTFRCDITPPMGHSLCGGWIKPVEAVDDPLEALGIVIRGKGEPIVVVAVDWTGVLNSGHLAWRKAIAKAAGTTADRVAIQCVHQHNAPFACPDAQRIVREYKELPAIVDEEFFTATGEKIASAVKASLEKSRGLTAIATGMGTVSEVAGNRRTLGPDGKLYPMRGSSCKDETLRALPEGLIDPQLRTVAFYDGSQKVAACHYYACHPMSYYGDGRVSSDFCGLARKAQQKADPDCLHIYFNGCGGNIAAGKYNDGSPEMRPKLTTRILDGIVQSETNLKRQEIRDIAWRTTDFLPTPDPRWDADALRGLIADPKQSVTNRNRSSYTLAWLERCKAAADPICLSALRINNVSLLHLPAECFIEYQLAAQKMAEKQFVACAAYGDGGPWYIPTEAAYGQGGYEVSVAWSEASVEQSLLTGINRLLALPKQREPAKT
jgi:hypothetical protein